MLYHEIFSINLVWNSKSTITLDILLPVLHFLLFLLFIFWVPPVLFLAITDRVWCIQYRPNLGRYPQGVKAISQVSWCFRWGRAGQYGHWVKIIIQEANPAYQHMPPITCIMSKLYFYVYFILDWLYAAVLVTYLSCAISTSPPNPPLIYIANTFEQIMTYKHYFHTIWARIVSWTLHNFGKAFLEEPNRSLIKL